MIRAEAGRGIDAPLDSERLAVRITFAAERGVRADVDNVAKPILDALKGVVYMDDVQVQELTIVAMPRGEAFRMDWLRAQGADFFERIMDREDPHFLVEVFADKPLPGL